MGSGRGDTAWIAIEGRRASDKLANSAFHLTSVYPANPTISDFRRSTYTVRVQANCKYEGTRHDRCSLHRIVERCFRLAEAISLTEDPLLVFWSGTSASSLLGPTEGTKEAVHYLGRLSLVILIPPRTGDA